jgi:hypothetical protein
MQMSVRVEGEWIAKSLPPSLFRPEMGVGSSQNGVFQPVARGSPCLDHSHLKIAANVDLSGAILRCHGLTRTTFPVALGHSGYSYSPMIAGICKRPRQGLASLNGLFLTIIYPPEVHWYIMAPFKQAVVVRLSSSDPSSSGNSPNGEPTGAVYEGVIDPTWNIGKWVYSSTIEA